MDFLLVTCLIVVVGCFLQAALMFLHAWEHRRFHASRWRSPIPSDAGLRVTLFVPCRGTDLEMESNLRALFLQREVEYELCFIVESERDSAVAVIESLKRQFPAMPCRVVVAGVADHCGQKVHNLAVATRRVLDVAPPEVLAFVDSDARPHPTWLARLLGRLASGKHAAATGYRWYEPVGPTLASRLLSAINNTVIGLMGSHRFVLVWGGAWAIRTETFRALGLPESWSGSLSDDLVVSRLLRDARLSVAYEPHCLVLSPAGFSWRQLAEFLRRQYLVVRTYAPRWWAFAFWVGLATNGAVGFLAGLAVAWNFADGPWEIPAAGLSVYYLLTAFRLALTARSVAPFVKVPRAKYLAVAALSVWGWPVVSLAHWLGVASAAFGRTIVWREIRYRMESSDKTVIVSRPAALPDEVAADRYVTNGIVMRTDAPSDPSPPRTDRSGAPARMP